MKLAPEPKRLITMLAILFMGVLVLVSTEKQQPPIKEMASINIPEPEIRAHSYLVKFIGEDKILIRRREWKKLAPASLTKLLTALVARQNLLPADWIIFSEKAKTVEEKISTVGVGESLLRDDAIRFALMGSANDAAEAMAEKLGERFLELINTEARRIGMSDSSFRNATGLDTEEHYSTALDLAKLAEYIWQNQPALWEMTRNTEAEVYSDTFNKYEIKTTNELLEEFPEILGGKTGFTDKARGTLILLYPVYPALMDKGGVKDKVAVIVILGSTDRFSDGRAIINWLRDNF
ncbi:MAG: D-alanyl-D-alanine carboxypeptidase [Candidatus Sungiibacteriota bacterium]|uniref:D-alanyl-D-alanine carboxypeptidase n=1 Tax=Candidatus Sungiibacteriota bacterium TaxID=2750080 RepID=A0A7T5RKC8_9BACT|nr:MAG: D-alanyl-D-alanine carboxypeptidase [Candidatus Sungbacteria bacterium]